MYQVRPRHLQQAKKLGVTIQPSKKGNYKLDVYKDGSLLASIGNRHYGDYVMYLEEKGKAYADERKRLYHIRHKNDKGVKGFLSRIILWT
jgi:hypothetical protein